MKTMKTMKFYAWALFFAFTSIAFTACSDDDPAPTPEIPDVPENPEAPEEPVDPVPETSTHFDIWVTLGGSTSMGTNDTYLVKSNIKDLSEGVLDFRNNGVDVTAFLYRETIIKGKYYYQIPQSGDRFGKYQLVDDKIETIWEFPFTTFEPRRFTHCWLDDNTLVLMGASGSSDKIIWAKINTETRASEEGVIDFSSFPEALPGEYEEGRAETYNTSGMAAYRESDGRILYSFVFNKGSAMRGASRGEFYTAFINPADMSVETVATEDRADMMAATAYGELLQEKSFFDENGDYYLACNSYLPNSTSTTQQRGALFRIKNGETAFDKSYNGYPYNEGKLVSINNLGNGKALLYIQDPDHTGASGWGATFNCYYSVLNMSTGVKENLSLPACQGTFAQFATVAGDFAYIGVYPETEDTAIWIYDIASGELKKGMTIARGYALDRILMVED